MKIELAKVKTDDGVRLHGALREPTEDPRLPIDAVMLVHGVGSNFYSSVMLDAIADAFIQVGAAALTINTRGHDGVSTASTDTGGRLQGAAYETVAECQSDLTAWTNFLMDRGHQRVAWVGHSLGAIKVLFAAAKRPHPSQPRIVAISPPRLSYARLVKSAPNGPFHRSLTEATRLAEAGRGGMLFEASFPFKLIISAQTFLDKYGPSERYNILRFANKVVPTPAFVFGADELHEGNEAFYRIREDLTELAFENPPRIEVIDRANHFYSGRLPPLCETLLSIFN